MLLNRSIIFVNGTEESRLAVVSKEREQTKSRGSIVTTQIQQLENFYPAEPEHQVCFSLIQFYIKLNLFMQHHTFFFRNKKKYKIIMFVDLCFVIYYICDGLVIVNRTCEFLIEWMIENGIKFQIIN